MSTLTSSCSDYIRHLLASSSWLQTWTMQLKVLTLIFIYIIHIHRAVESPVSALDYIAACVTLGNTVSHTHF